jgi:histone deacetylase complex regulatory component SIN3
MSSPGPIYSQQLPLSPSRLPIHLPIPSTSTAGLSQNHTSTEDNPSFFEVLKRSLDDPEIYEEFLKVLQMFTMDIIDGKTLLDRIAPLFNQEQMEQFLELVEWDEPPGAFQEDVVGNGDSIARRRALRLLEQGHRFKTTHIGPSYRSTPAAVSTCCIF